MDVFCEYIVTKKKEALDYFIIFSVAVAVILLTYILMIVMFAFKSFASIVLLLIVGCWWGGIQLIKGRSMEFEYILTNHELDIDRIVARSRRKRLCSIDFKHIDVCASTSDPTFAHIYKNTAERKILNLAGDADAENVYFVDYSHESQQMRVLFQPSKRILDGIKKCAPRTVNVKEGDL
ncbi:MAG: hypothetical protein KIG65_01855 [Eubacteriales bacterium]|nr:hypothetical protein [Eubacteriales bacterium]